jgi:hypothetical protein
MWAQNECKTPVQEQNNLKKAEKMYLRIGRYYRNKDSMKNFLEEDPNSLEFRDCMDQIQGIHSVNFCKYSELLLRQNKTKEALDKIQDGLDKIDHRHQEGNQLKVKILRVMNKWD